MIYTVAWYIDIEAKSMKAAVKQAQELLTGSPDTKWCFVVAPHQATPTMKGERTFDMEKSK